MKHFGKVKPGSTLYIEFDTFGTSGESLTMSGLAVTDIEIYKDGGTTQRASDNGYTLLDTDGIDFDGLTGIHGFSINLADNSDAGFYAAGSRYRVVVSSVTVNSQTVSFTAATFEIAVDGALLSTTIATLSTQTSFTLTAGPAEDDALNGCVAYIHDVASAVQGGFAVVLDYTGSTKTVTLAAGTTFTAAATDNIGFFPPANVTHAASVAWGSGAITAGSLATGAITAAKFAAGAIDAAAIATGAIDADALAADTITSAKIADNAITAAKINSGAITSAKFAAGAIDAAAIADGAIDEAALAADARTRIQTECEEALAAFNLDHLVGTATGIPAVPAGTFLDQIMDDGTASYDRTTDSLQAIRDASASLTDLGIIASTTIATLASQTSFTLTAGSADNDAYNSCRVIITDASTAVQKCTGTILDYTGSTKTVTLSADPAIFTMAAGDGIVILPPAGSGLDAAGVRAAVGLASANLDTQLDAIPTVSEMNARTLAAADYATAAALDTVDNFLDTEIATLITQTGAAAIRSAIGLASANLDTQLDALPTTSEVLAQVNAALDTAIAELGVAAPSATPTMRTGLMLLYMALRNRTTTTATAQTIQNDAGTTIATAALSDDGTTFTKAEFA